MQLPKRDYKEALLTDMKSKIESICYSKDPWNKQFAAKGRLGVHAFGYQWLRKNFFSPIPRAPFNILF